MKKLILLFMLIPIMGYAQNGQNGYYEPLDKNPVHFFDSTEKAMYSIPIRDMVNFVIESENAKKPQNKIIVVYIPHNNSKPISKPTKKQNEKVNY